MYNKPGPNITPQPHGTLVTPGTPNIVITPKYQDNSCTTLNKSNLTKVNPKYNEQGPNITSHHSNLATPGTPNRVKSATQTSMLNYISKGRKRLNSVQLTAPDNNKKLNSRVVSTNRDYTVNIIKSLLDEIIESAYPLFVPSIFDHLKTRDPLAKHKYKPKVKTRPKPQQKHRKNKILRI